MVKNVRMEKVLQSFDEMALNLFECDLWKMIEIKPLWFMFADGKLPLPQSFKSGTILK